MKLNEAIADWWLTNARAKHGHPPVSEGVTIPEQQQGGMSTLAKVALSAVAGGALATGAGYLAPLLSGEEKTEAVQTTTQGDGSLYQYLEDQGYHLP